MPINQINPTAANAQKKDPMERILQGLQIANEVFKIPVAYQDFRGKGAEADAKGLEADSLKNLSEGNVDAIAQVKNKLRQVALPSGQTGAVIPPSEAGVVGGGPTALAPPGPALTPPAPQPSALLPKGTQQFKNGAFITQEAADKNDEALRNRTQDVFKISEKYDAAHRAIESMNELVDLAKKGNPAAQLQYIKAFNQFNDTPRFTEGESNAFNAMSPLRDQMNKFWNDIVNGKKVVVPGALISQIQQASVPLTKAQNDAHKDLLTPLYQGAVSNNQPVNEIFSPHALSLLKGEKKDVPASKDSPKPKPQTVIQNGHTYTLQKDGSYK